MKSLSILPFALITSVSGVTIRVEGYLEGSAASLEFRGDTMDYYKFQVLNTGPVRIEIVPGFEGGLYHLAQFIGREDEFALTPIGVPSRINPPGREGKPQFLEGIFPAGTYVFATTAGGRTSYDIFDGFEAVNREGGGFQRGAYQYDITGDVQGLQYWDGHLDGTFTVTNIPEPSSALFLGVVALLFTRRRRE